MNMMKAIGGFYSFFTYTDMLNMSISDIHRWYDEALSDYEKREENNG